VDLSPVESNPLIQRRATSGSLGLGVAWHASRSGLLIAAAIAAWAMAAAVTLAVPDQPPNIFTVYTYTTQLGVATGGMAASIALVTLLGVVVPPVGRRLARAAPWLVALGVLAGAYELATAKESWLPLPYFTAPQSVLGVYKDDGPLLLECIGYSMRLLAIGFASGAALGFLTGVAMGWSQRLNYWLYPIVRTIGPVPATAWLPVAFVLLPTNTIASLFLIGLASWFPVALLTWSGVAGVSRGYYDVARTLGARNRFLIVKVAVPAALPSVFVGLFMGLGGAFVTLLVAEQLGVKAGLGWYLQWALGWGEWKKAWAALLIMILLFSGLITLLFRLRNWALAWQQGLVRW
jgi:NitT/TauT family transport system permease protein